MLTASGERVVLQKVTVVVQRTNGTKIVTARVLLDSASQRTFLTDQLAQLTVKLKADHKELLSVSTFGARQVIKIDTYVDVKLKDGSNTYVNVC